MTVDALPTEAFLTSAALAQEVAQVDWRLAVGSWRLAVGGWQKKEFNK